MIFHKNSQILSGKKFRTYYTQIRIKMQEGNGDRRRPVRII